MNKNKHIDNGILQFVLVHHTTNGVIGSGYLVFDSQLRMNTTLFDNENKTLSEGYWTLEIVDTLPCVVVKRAQ